MAHVMMCRIESQPTAKYSPKREFAKIASNPPRGRVVQLPILPSFRLDFISEICLLYLLGFIFGILYMCCIWLVSYSKYYNNDSYLTYYVRIVNDRYRILNIMMYCSWPFFNPVELRRQEHVEKCRTYVILQVCATVRVEAKVQVIRIMTLSLRQRKEYI